jgi:hypothetical protein
MAGAIGGLLLASSLGITPMSAQGAGALASRIEGVRDGAVRLSFPARDGVCGNGTSWSQTRDGSRTGTFTRNDVDVTCEPGPVRVVLIREAGRTRDVRTYVGGTWRASDASTDLGAVSAEAATEWLLREVERGDEEAAKDALMPITIADTEVPWTRVLDVARNTSRPQSVRKQAMFWSAHAAGERAAAQIGVIARDDPDVEVRKHAVFALSQHENGVEQLLQIARTSTDREVKKAAYFWLGQSRDPRAAALFAEVLGRP